MQIFKQQISDPFRTLFTGVVDLIYPPMCLACEQRLHGEEVELCFSCLSSLNTLHKPHEQFSVPGEIHIETAWALFEFDDVFQNLIHHLKYSRRRKAMIVVLDHYKTHILNLLESSRFDLVVSIPLHPRKYRERGYNQVDDVSDWLAELLGAETGTHVVKRTKYTQSQTKLNATQRYENVAAAFQVKHAIDIEHKRILLVDDVLTTGATSNALASVLSDSGAARIDLLTLSTPKFLNT